MVVCGFGGCLANGLLFFQILDGGGTVLPQPPNVSQKVPKNSAISLFLMCVVCYWREEVVGNDQAWGDDFQN